MKHFTYLIALLALTGLMFLGCNSGENPIAANDNDAALDTESALLDEGVTLGKHGSKKMGIVTVVHGVPGLTVDVYVNGALTLPGFEPGTVTDPLKLPEGDYNIVIVPKGGDPANPAIEGDVFLPARANASIVAHLSEGGSPTLSVFVNDLSKIKKGAARVVVRHCAAVVPVDVLLYKDKKAMKLVGKLENIANSEEAQADVRAGKYMATINPAGSDVVAVGPAMLKLKPHRSNILYAVGSLSDGTFELLGQEIRLRSKKHK
jgi:hypothetical protein